MHEKPKRRWLRFSVRTLAIFITIFCVWLGWAVKRSRERQQARQWLDAHESYTSESHVPVETTVAPWGLSLIGETGITDITLVKQRIPESELMPAARRMRRLFPEARIHIVEPFLSTNVTTLLD